MKKILTLSAVVLLSNFAFSQSGTQTFTSSGTFTVPSGITNITIEVVGAGGSGGGNGTGGGGGGGYSMGSYTVVPFQVIPVIIGTPGNGTTAVSAYIQASGGSDGISVANPNIGGGGAGGVGSGGTVNYTGGTGGGGYYTYFGGGGGGAAGASGNGFDGGNTIAWTGICQTPGGTGGAAGGAPGGMGGKGAGFTDVNCNVTDPAGNGLNYGGGGGGGNGNGGGPGTGASGYAIITWGTSGIANAISGETNFIVQNPFTTTIKLQNSIGNENYELFDNIGALIWAGKNIQEQDFSSLASGMYILKVSNEKTAQTFKLLKE